VILRKLAHAQAGERKSPPHTAILGHFVSVRVSTEGGVQPLLEHVVEATVGAAQILSRPFLWDKFGG
jgi:hypothetical protein